MKKVEIVRVRGFVAATLAVSALVTPGLLSAHPGHSEGDHGWLLGAVQPFLSWDHFLAGMFVVAVAAAGMTAAGRRGARVEGKERV